MQVIVDSLYKQPVIFMLPKHQAMRMNILFDIGHPAHVHLCKHFIVYLIQAGHTVVVVTRDKDITNCLLDHYKIPFLCLSSPGRGFTSMFRELVRRDMQIWKLHQQHQFDAVFGTSVSGAHLAAISQVRSFTFNEDDDKVVPLFTYVTYPFTTTIFNPDCIHFTKWAAKRVFYPSYHELAYLHPNQFTPDKTVLEKYGLEARKYVMLRCSALKAHHDVGVKGLSRTLQEAILPLLSGYQVVTSKEGELASRIAPWDMHHVLAFAKMLIADSQTMTAEASVLGTPAIRYNSFVGKLSYLEELEHSYELTYGFSSGQEDNMLQKIIHLLQHQDIYTFWQAKRQKMLAQKVDLNQWMIEYFEHNNRGKSMTKNEGV
ncbi:MAG: hypothetical protein GY801_31340 [bacterium]|nr:hypothetical protein [bacterium]